MFDLKDRTVKTFSAQTKIADAACALQDAGLACQKGGELEAALLMYHWASALWPMSSSEMNAARRRVVAA